MNVELIPVLEVVETDGNTLAGTAFQKLVDITDQALTDIVKKHTHDLRAGQYGREQACALSGGYVLVIDQLPIFYPQCCGDLADIHYWRKVAQGQDAYYEGHPAPQLDFKADFVEFDFSTTETDEPFMPTPPITSLKVNQATLHQAIERCLLTLNAFSQRLEQINQLEGLGIEQIDQLLVWNPGNHV
ncbi:hypothetical protein JYG30_19680 [Fibrella sp. USSR17]